MSDFANGFHEMCHKAVMEGEQYSFRDIFGAFITEEEGYIATTVFHNKDGDPIFGLAFVEGEQSEKMLEAAYDAYDPPES